MNIDNFSLKFGRHKEYQSLMSNNVPESLKQLIIQLYAPLKIEITSDPVAYKDHKLKEYGATRLGLNNYMIEFRVGKKTHDRPGNFLTTWHRDASSGKIVPFHIGSIDFLVIYVSERIKGIEHKGLFIFNETTLSKNGILSTDNTKGRLAFRVFPPWSEYSSQESIKKYQTSKAITKPMQAFTRSARKTQLWQNEYFTNIDKNWDAENSQLISKLISK